MIEAVRFDNRFIRELPGDSEPGNFRRQVNAACYSRVMPAPVIAPRTLAVSPEVAKMLDFTPEFVASPDFARVFGGCEMLPGMEPFAMCYGGHQFGHWAGQLGDGRAIILGELMTRQHGRQILQLKGAGPTPYSRTADGLAVLRSSVREFLCSEAMHHLGVPTTRALSLVTTGEEVVRDMFYSGNPRPEPGAIVCRVAPSFTRFGNFEILAARGEVALLGQLVDYTIATDFPELGAPDAATRLAWLREVARRTAVLMAHWMRVGFVHGVMNTDNMSILGLTLDYGPYGWLEDYNPDWTPNTTDSERRRYRYGTQPQVGMWNLVQLANALYPLVEDVPSLEAALAIYPETYEKTWREMLAAKLGLQTFDAERDQPLCDELFAVMQLTETDMTLFFRSLANPRMTGASSPETLWEALQPAFYTPESISPAVRERILAWVSGWLARVEQDGAPAAERQACMNRVNPLYVLRNYLAQLAIDQAESGDPGLIVELLDTLRRPCEVQPGRDHLAAKRPDWARQRAGCSMLSCSS
jgi:uncharacterized protein YdiU (UPF0061 family)